MQFRSDKHPWDLVGIESPGSVVALVLNAATQYLVANIEHPHPDGRSINRLYYRHIHAPRYVPVPASGDDIDHHNVVSADGKPFVLFQVRRMRRIERGWGGGPVALARLALPSGEVELVAPNFHPPRGYAYAWVSWVLRVHHDARSVSALVGVQRANDRNVEYWLAELADGQISLSARMPTPFI